MIARKTEIIIQEMRSLLPYYLAVNAVYFAVVLVIFFTAGYDFTLITGAVYGNIIGVLNFYILGKTAQRAVRKSPKSAQTYMNAMYCIRYLGLFAAMTMAALVPFIELLTAVIPLLFVKFAITIRAVRERNKD